MLSYRRFASVFFILLFSPFLFGDEKIEKKPFKIIIGLWDRVPSAIEPPIIRSSTDGGAFWGVLGEELSEKDIKDYMNMPLIGGKVILILKFDSQKETSLNTLAKVLSMLKKLANPKIETIIHVYLSGAP